MLDTMAGEAMWLRHLLGLPVRETSRDKKDEPLNSDAGETNTPSGRHTVGESVDAAHSFFITS